MNEAYARGPWLPGGEPKPGRIARAALRSVADIARIEDAAPDRLVPATSLYGAIRSAASLEPEKIAIKHLLSVEATPAPRVILYRELVALLEQAANLFHQASRSPGARSSVAVILPMVPEALVVTWAAATAGIAVPINPFLEMEQLVSILKAAEVTVLVTASAKHGAGAWSRVDEIRARVPTLRAVYVVDADADDPGEAAHDFLRALATQPHGRLTFTPSSDPAADAFYLPTGGTTAAPKLVRMTHGGQLLNAWTVGALVGAARDEVVAHALPLFHVGGLVTIALRAMIYGQTLVTLTTAGFRNPGVIGSFWKVNAAHGVTNIVLTPTTAAAIVATGEAMPATNKLTSFHCGGSTIPVEIVESFHDRFGIWLRESWGMSELYGIITGHPDDGQPVPAGSVGHVLPFYRVKIAELDEANRFVRELPTGERGVLVVNGPAVVPGYAERALDRDLFVTGMPDGGSWVSTGDLGMRDGDGRLWLFGRAKDLIIRGGHNLDPRAIEEVLAQHPAVQLSAAIGRPDADKGELPMAYVQLKPGLEGSAEELVAFCRERIQERAAVPVEIVVVPAIPLTPVGKVYKPALRLDALRKVATRVIDSVLGEGATGSTASLVLDEAGPRPTVVVTVHGGDEDARHEKLRAVFRCYEFSTTILSSSAARGGP
jgi:fatty-acyl-CoA synthase